MTIDTHTSKEHILTFLRDNHVGVLATVDTLGRPYASTVYFTYDKELNLYFLTKKETKKSKHLNNNTHAAVAIYEAVSQRTIQATGVVKAVTDNTIFGRVFHEINRIVRATSGSGNLPTTKMMAGSYIVYCLSPSFIRLAAFSPSTQRDMYENIFEIA